jgi:single-stranded-DNA-specific exonuclease
MGRVGDPAIAAQLLLAPEAATADDLALQLEAANLLRRELTTTAMGEAREVMAAQPDSPFLVLAGDWPVGVIGLVAGRLAEETDRPTLVLSRVETPWRGSARSAAGFDLAAAFDSCADLFERHGGHPGAAGCHIAADRVDELRERLDALAARGDTVPQQPRLSIDLVQSADAADYVLLHELEPLEDAAEAPPLVGIVGLVVLRARVAKGGHLQLTLRRGREVVDGISFGRADLAEQLTEGLEIDVVARLMSRTFAGLETLQLDIRDMAPAGSLASLREHSRGVPSLMAR